MLAIMTTIPTPPAPVAGVALPLSDHAAILPELIDWARDRVPNGAFQPAELAAILAHSRHLQTLARAHPDLVTSVLAGDGEAEMDQAMASCREAASTLTDEAKMMTALRHLRQRSALCVALADMADLHDVETQMRWLSMAADAAVQSAVSYLFKEAARRGQLADDNTAPRAGISSDGAGCGWSVMALGKLGAGELNYSSDIDLVLLHDPVDNPLSRPDTSQRFYVEMARGLVRLLSTATRDGIGWRVDLRLRPDPGATAVSIQREAAIGYYESIARTWERAAFIRARPIAGDIAMGTDFLTEIKPFIWRRTLDYTVMDDMKMMLRPPAAGLGWEGYNLKTGPNGIRSIEFLTHVLQLVGGGRCPALRVGSTLPALRALAAENWIAQDQCEQLAMLYLALRRTEHRLQMMADAQTHSLPRTRTGIEEAARFMGHECADDFLAELANILDQVATNTSHRLFAEPEDDLPEGTDANAKHGDTDAPLLSDADQLASWLDSRGFQRPADIAAVLDGWMAGRIAATRGERARNLLSRIMPPMISHLSGAQDPDAAFAAFAGFVEGLPASVQIFSLLDHNRELTRLLGDILVLSPRLGDRLRRHPMLFDLVLFASFFEPIPTTDDLEAELRAAITSQPTELALDTVTRVTRERQFRAEVQHVSGVADRRALGIALAGIAEAAIRVIRDLAIMDMQRRHGTINGDLGVLAMGRLGVGDLTSTSDLDLIFIWDAPEGEHSTGLEDGKRNLGARTYFTRLAQTLANWLAGATGEGKLFTIDLRLRPNGEQSAVATSLVRFTDYYAQEAWLWEKLALAKARLVTPAAKCGTAIIASLAAPRTTQLPQDAIAESLHDMRGRLRASYGDADKWQLRKQPGGISELDLLMQALRFLHADLFDNDVVPVDRLLSCLVESGRLAADDADALAAANNLYADLQHALRLVLGTSATDPGLLSPAARQFICNACDSPDIEALQGHIAAHQAQVDDLFDRLFPPPAV